MLAFTDGTLNARLRICFALSPFWTSAGPENGTDMDRMWRKYSTLASRAVEIWSGWLSRPGAAQGSRSSPTWLKSGVIADNVACGRAYAAAARIAPDPCMFFISYF